MLRKWFSGLRPQFRLEPIVIPDGGNVILKVDRMLSAENRDALRTVLESRFRGRGITWLVVEPGVSVSVSPNQQGEGADGRA